MHIAMANNVLVPAYLAVLAKGYAVEPISDLPGWLRATKGEHTFVAGTPIELLGLIAMAELRGEDWSARDDEIDNYLKRFA